MSKLEETTEALVQEEEEDFDKEKSTTEAVMDIWNLAKNIVIGALFHPVYTIVNAATLGRVATEELAGFGLGSLTLGIMALSIGACFGGGLSTFISQSFGAKDLRSCAVYKNRQIFLATIVYLILSIPMIFI
jgi:Na+-driven multidrug efflux pump